ncbi:MAG: hypothetical protein K6E45_03515 [Bacteroidaceae bacterium]|nr:hypothetical protein [Bacteroidaceae bacterium]
MKKFLFLALAVLISGSVSAQSKVRTTQKKAPVARKAAPQQKKAAPQQRKTYQAQSKPQGGGSFWRTRDRADFNLLQLGYMRETYCNGVFLGYKHGWNLTSKLPLYIEPGAELHYVSRGADNSVGVTIPVDFSYKFKTGDFSISPVTGPTLGYIHDFNKGTYDDNYFVLGWDFGARLAYKRVTLSYRYNKVLYNNGGGDEVWNFHKLAVGFTF